MRWITCPTMTGGGKHWPHAFVFLPGVTATFGRKTSTPADPSQWYPEKNVNLCFSPVPVVGPAWVFSDDAISTMESLEKLAPSWWSTPRQVQNVGCTLWSFFATCRGIAVAPPAAKLSTAYHGNLNLRRNPTAYHGVLTLTLTLGAVNIGVPWGLGWRAVGLPWSAVTVAAGFAMLPLMVNVPQRQG